jgi:hypothetical protein
MIMVDVETAQRRWFPRMLQLSPLIGPEARIDREETRKAAQDQPRADQEHDGQRDLNYDQRGSCAASCGFHAEPRRSSESADRESRPNGQRGDGAESQSRRHADSERECQYGGVDMDIGQAGNMQRFRNQGYQGARAPDGNDRSGDTRDNGERKAFGEELRGEPCAGCPQCDSQRHFAATRQGTRDIMEVPERITEHVRSLRIVRLPAGLTPIASEVPSLRSRARLSAGNGVPGI